jgi:cell shape-determining protein MreC
MAAFAVAIGLFFAPDSVTSPLRTSVRDSASPGQKAYHSLSIQLREFWDGLHPQSEDDIRLTKIQQQLRSSQLRCRKLQVRTAQLQAEKEQIKIHGSSPYAATDSPKLIVVELLLSRVLGRENTKAWRAGHLIDNGSEQGIDESALVLQDDRPLIDQGEPQNLRSGHLVLAGRCVVGKIANVGRWTSSVQLVTDPKFRSWVQFARSSGVGLIFGSEGVFEGTGGELCKVTLVSATESVEVGDAVYSGGRDNLLPAPMYYGQVVKAELKPGALHWDVWVKPALQDQQLRTVQVLRKSINPVRMLGQ